MQAVAVSVTCWQTFREGQTFAHFSIDMCTKVFEVNAAALSLFITEPEA